MKILIVEDNAIISFELKRTIQNAGYEVVGIAKSCDEAMVLVDLNKPEIILMDVGLKGDLNGIETAFKIQKSHTFKLIYMTGNSFLKENADAIRTNPSEILIKPIIENHLIDLLNEIERKKAS